MSTNLSFTDRVVIVTGSSSGIGRAIAIHFAALGANVVICGRNQGNVQKVLDECNSIGKAEHLSVIGDITKDEDCRTLINETVNKFGKINVLINNAGIGAVIRIDNPAIMTTFDQVYATNVRPVVLLCHLAIPHLVLTRGNIVNISSAAGLRPWCLGGVPYCSAKSALNMIGRTLAVELGDRGIRVNTVNPAIVRTPMIETVGKTPEESERTFSIVDRNYPLGRAGTSEEVARTVAFLAADDSSWTSGVCLNIDGASLDCNNSHLPKEVLEEMVKFSEGSK